MSYSSRPHGLYSSCNSSGQNIVMSSVQFRSVTQLCPTLWTPWTAARQASLSITNSQSLLKLTSIESVMPSNHLICRPLLLPLSIFPSIKVFFNESVLSIRWSKYWRSLSFSPSMNIQDWRPLGCTGWISLLSKGLSGVSSNTTVQQHHFFGLQFSL